MQKLLLSLRGVKFHRANFFRKNSITNLDRKIHRKFRLFCYEILSFFATNFIACHAISSPKFRFRNSLNLVVVLRNSPQNLAF